MSHAQRMLKVTPPACAYIENFDSVVAVWKKSSKTKKVRSQLLSFLASLVAGCQI